MFLPYLKNLLLLLLWAHQVQLMRRRLVVRVVIWCSAGVIASATVALWTPPVAATVFVLPPLQSLPC
jgi:hypothetical protein